MTTQERMQRDMVEAMRRKEELRLSVLRMAKAAFRNREIEKRKTLDDAECEQVISTLIKQRHDATEQYRRGGREEQAAREEGEIRILEEYLPAPAAESDIDAAIDAAIAETGASSAKQMGAVMKATMVKLAGKRVEGKLVSEKVKARLS